MEVPRSSRSKTPAGRTDFCRTWGPVSQAIKTLKRDRSLKFLRGQHYTIQDVSFKRGLYVAAERAGEKIKVSILRDATGSLIGYEVWRTSYGPRGPRRASQQDHS